MRWNVLQLTAYHELRVTVELRSTDIREQLRAVDVVQRTVSGQLEDEAKQRKVLEAAAEKLELSRLQCDKHLQEIDRKIRSVERVGLITEIK